MEPITSPQNSISSPQNSITSLQNPLVKRLVALQQKSSERRKAGLFVVEGQRELMHCIAAGHMIETVYYCPALLFAEDRIDLHRSNADVDSEALLKAAKSCVEVSTSVYDKIAYRGGTEGIIATVRPRSLSLEDLLPADGHSPLYVVLESVEKPGNLGAILRSADAARVDGVIVCDPLTDLYNPNLIRSSIGAIFTVPTVACSSADCIAWMNANGVQILTAQLQDSHLYYDTDMTVPTAIVMGTEATGLTEQWRKAANAHIRIPMMGHLDSLNVSVSAAILMFEAVRQRSK